MRSDSLDASDPWPVSGSPSKTVKRTFRVHGIGPYAGAGRFESLQPVRSRTDALGTSDNSASLEVKVSEPVVSVQAW
ncbi:MAG: hypothetical protein ACI8X5_003729 [Planctomycetota bacterium]|jgi:hypothetical protein